MELRDLRALLAVVRAGSFTAAAGELGYTQSAVSQQVAALEVEVGQLLLERRPVRPTPAGERLAEHAARILLRVDVARSELAHLGRESSAVSVAVCPLAAPTLVAAALRQLRNEHPTVRVTVRTVGVDAAVASVASGEADVAVVDGITAPDDPLRLTDPGLLVATGLVEAPLVVALPSGHPLAGRAVLDLDVLADAPWVAAPALTTVGMQSPASPGAVVYEGSDLPTLLNLIAAGHGTALLPATAPTGGTGVATVALRRPALVHRTEVLNLRTVGGLQRRFVEMLRSRGTLQ